METPILATKLYLPPPPPNAIARPALHSRLQRGLAGKATLVVAPAGFGKTTLVSQWLATGAQPVAWLTLDAHDNTPSRFLTYLLAALRSLYQPGHATWGAQTAALLAAPQSPPLTTVLTTLVNEVAYTPLPLVPLSLILVLDDYHLIAAPAVHEAVDFLLTYLPPHLHLVILSRAEPPLTLARLRASGSVTEVHADDLRFSQAETAAFLATAVDLPLHEEAVAALATHTTGWAAGLRLVAMRLQADASRQDATHLASTLTTLLSNHRPLLDYLTVEIFDHLPVARQQFLVQTALLDRLCGDLCTAVTGNPQSPQLLAALAQEQLFVTGLDDRHYWYRYHGLFAEFLRARLAQLDPALIRALHERAARWYADQGLLSAAIEHGLAAQAYAFTAALIETNAMQMVHTTEVTRLAQWLQALPPALVAASPLLAFAQAGTALLQAQFELANQWLSVAEAALTKPAVATLPLPVATLRGYLDAVRATIMVNLHQDVAATIAVAQRALANLPADEHFLRGAVALNLGDAYCHLQENRRAEQAFAEAVALTAHLPNLTPHLAALGSQAGLSARQGNLHQAAAILRQAIAVGEAWGKATAEAHPATGKVYGLYAGILYEWNQVDRAEAAARQAIACCQRWGHVQHQLDGYLYLLNALVAQQKFTEATATLTAARLIATESWTVSHQQAAPMGLAADLRDLVDRAQLRLWLRQGRLGDVAAWLAQDALRDQLALAFIRARLALGRRHWALAAQQLAAVAAQLAQQTDYGSQIKLLLLQAQLADGREQPAAALQYLDEALTLAAPNDYLRTFLEEAAALTDLWQLAAQQGRLSDYGRRVYRLCGAPSTPPSAPASLSVPAAALVEPLSDREVEVLHLLAADLTYQAIGDTLFISLNTVRTHAKNIYSKLGVNRRSEALAAARTVGLL